MSGAAISSLGLLLDIGGVLLLWRFGLPEAVNRGGFGYAALVGEDPAEKAKAERYDYFARIGLILLIGGFALQLLGNWLP